MPGNFGNPERREPGEANFPTPISKVKLRWSSLVVMMSK